MTISSAVVTVGTTPTLLAAHSGGIGLDGAHLTIRNNSATADVFIGAAAVTIANGMILTVGARIDFPVRAGDKVYAVVTVGTAPVAVLTSG